MIEFNELIGTNLLIDDSDADVLATPETLGGLRLPAVFQLCSTFVRHRGLLIGQSWFLQSSEEAEDGVLGGVRVRGGVRVIAGVYGDECMDLIDRWAVANGYVFDPLGPSEYRKA